MKNFSLRIDRETLEKLHYIADEEVRSANQELLHLIRRHIALFEAKHGEIPLDEEKKAAKE